MMLPIPFDVLAMPTLAIQHVGSHETESATISDGRLLSRKGCHTTAIFQSHTIADDRRFRNRECDRPITDLQYKNFTFNV